MERADKFLILFFRDGDLAIIRMQHDAEEGDIVAVFVEGLEIAATLKVLRRKPETLELLHPATPAYEPVILRGDEQSRVRILGKVVGIVRRVP